MSRRTCHTDDCAIEIFPNELFCQSCRAMFTPETRAALARLYRPGKAPTKALLLALAEAHREIAYVRQTGSAEPRAQMLPFDGAEVFVM